MFLCFKVVVFAVFIMKVNRLLPTSHKAVIFTFSGEKAVRLINVFEANSKFETPFFKDKVK